MRVLMVTSGWPTVAHPEHAPFVVRQVRALERHGLQIDVVHVDGRGNPLNYARRWREIRKLTSHHRYDVIHAQWGQAALVALPASAPLVVTFRGSDLEGIAAHGGGYRWSSWMLRRLSKLAAGRADEIVVVSERLRRHLGGRPCHVIPSGLDLELFAPMDRADARRRLGLSLSKRYVLFAASPKNPVKRYPLARQAVDQVRDRFDVDLLTATDVLPTEMPIYMSACDVLLLTSLHEGSPNVVKEALACNLPVVSVDVGDVRERLAGVDGCILSDDAQPAALAGAVCTVLARDRPVDGRSAVLGLDERLLAAQVISVYQRAIAGRKRA